MSLHFNQNNASHGKVICLPTDGILMQAYCAVPYWMHLKWRHVHTANW